LAVYLSGLREGDRLLYIILLKKVVNEKIINGFISSLTGGGEFQRVSVLKRKIQTMRKDSNFNVMDRITVTLSGNAKVLEIAKKNESAIFAVVLSDPITEGTGEGKEWDINGEKVFIAVTRV
jgi:isoleucyl-tRNA synthetase